MHHIKVLERDLTADELEQVHNGFKENEIFHTQVIQTFDRMGCVLVDGDKFLGCSSGLAYKNGEKYSGWFYLTDLFIEKEYRGQGYGKMILENLEKKLHSLGIKRIYTWTASFQAPEFYKKQGYRLFAELEGFYKDGQSRIGLLKNL